MKIKVIFVILRILFNNMIYLSINYIEWKFFSKKGSIRVKEVFEDYVIYNLYINMFICWYFDGNILYYRIRLFWIFFIYIFIVICLYVLFI